MPQQSTRNQIFQALLSQLQTAVMPASIGAIQLWSQRFIHWDNCPVQPAVMVIEGPQTAQEKGPFGLVQWSMRAIVLVYFKTDPAQDGTIPAVQINDLLDAFEAAMRAPNGGAQTLGGVVVNAQLDGAVGFDDGTVDQSYQAVVMIPVRIVVA